MEMLNNEGERRQLGECQFLIDVVWMGGFCMLCRLYFPLCS